MSIEDYVSIDKNIQTLRMDSFKTYISVGEKQYPLSITQMQKIFEVIYSKTEMYDKWTVKELREAIEDID
jgi:hypothetical protein